MILEELSRSWEVITMELNGRDSYLYNKTRTSSLSPLSAVSSNYEGYGWIFFVSSTKMANNGLVFKCFMSKFHLEGMNLDLKVQNYVFWWKCQKLLIEPKFSPFIQAVSLHRSYYFLVSMHLSHQDFRIKEHASCNSTIKLRNVLFFIQGFTFTKVSL